MRFNDKAITIFLDPNSLVKYNGLNSKKINIILSPSLYWVKKVSLPVKYVRDALKLLPSIFEDILPEGTYSYSAYKDGNEFFIFAYKDKEIIEVLSNIGISLSNVSKIFFAQSEINDIKGALKINETQSLYIKDEIVILVPCCWIDGDDRELNIENIKLSKHTIRLKQYGHIVDVSSFYKVSAILSVLSILIFAEYFIIKQEILKIEDMKSKIFKKYNLKSTMFQNKSMLKKYQKVHLKQSKIREVISYVLSFRVTKEKLSIISFKDNLIKAEFIDVNNMTLKNLKDFLTSKKVNFKVQMINSKIYLEIIL